MTSLTAPHTGPKNYGSGFNGNPPKDEEPVETEMPDKVNQRCGYGFYRPEWMQAFNNSKFLLVLISSIAFIQSFVVNGINNVNTTSYERRFGLRSSQVGFIASAYDISAGILSLPVTYYALHGHKHVIMALASGALALGSFIMWLPHLTTGIYEYGAGSSDLCSGNGTSCVAYSANSDNDISFYLYVLILGQLINGAGGTTLYSVGVSCLDDCVTAKTAPIYLGIMYAVAALGPAIGYVLGGYLLDTYVDYDKVSSDLTPDDPRWVGAWWIGFVIAMVLAVILSVPLLGMPREIRGTREAKATRVSEAHGGSDQKDLDTSFKELPKVTRSLLKNPTLILLTLAACSEGIAVSGYSTFTPKFIQNQFGQSAGFSAILTGLIAVPGAAGGFLLGGYVCRRFQMKIPGLTRLCVLSCVISLVSASVMWTKCDGIKMAGINTAYNDSSVEIAVYNLQESCNSGCECTEEHYAPVCGSNGLQYFSACHAGCTQKDVDNYKNCGCINSTIDSNQTVTEGVCSTPCPMLYVFIPIFLILIITTFLPATLITIATLRCVPDHHKTFALGIQWLIGRFLGTVPGPILFGAIIDSACLVWKKACGTKDNESCWIYDDFAMGRNFFLAGVCIKLVSTLFYLTANCMYKPPDNVTENTADATPKNEANLERMSEKANSENRNAQTPTKGGDNSGFD